MFGTSIPIVLFPGNNPAFAGKRVTLRDEQPVPFWTALDRICAGPRLRLGEYD